MIVSLTEFHYYFSLTGRRGGLFSIEAGFALSGDGGEGTEAVKHAMQGVMDRHISLCDRVFAEILVGKREPKMTDTAHSVCAGYVYKGTYPSGLRRYGRPDNARRLASIFGIVDPDLRGGSERHSSYEAAIDLESFTF